MKRDRKLILKILRHVRDNGNGKRLDLPDFEDYSPSHVAYHARLCDDAAFVRLKNGLKNRRATVHLGELTWAGHDYLEEHCDG